MLTIIVALASYTFADAADRVVEYLSTPGKPEKATQMLQELALLGKIDQLEKIRAKHPEAFSIRFFPDDLITKIIINYAEAGSLRAKDFFSSTGKTNPFEEYSWQWYIWDMDNKIKSKDNTNSSAVSGKTREQVDGDISALKEIATEDALDDQIKVNIMLYLYSFDPNSLPRATTPSGAQEETAEDWLNNRSINCATAILAFLFKAGLAFPSNLPSSMNMNAWNREVAYFCLYTRTHNPSARMAAESIGDFEKRDMAWRRTRASILSTEITSVPAQLNFGHDASGGYYKIGISEALPFFQNTDDADRSLWIHILNIDKIDIRFYSGSDDPIKYELSQWKASVTLSAKEEGIYTIKWVDIFADGKRINDKLWAFSVLPTYDREAAQSVRINNYIKDRMHKFAGINVSGDTALIPIKGDGEYTFTSGTDDQKVLWRKNISVADLTPCWHWILRYPPIPGENIISITSSADGERLAAASKDGGIWLSSDGGATWQEANEPGRNKWISIASSADGSHLAAIYPNGLWISVDAGSSWSSRDTSQILTFNPKAKILISSDGSRIVIFSPINTLLISTDGGASWKHDNVAGGDISSSADGGRISILNEGNHVNTSADGGQTWTQHPAKIFKIASSADGMLLAGLAGMGPHTTGYSPFTTKGYIWTSTDAGATWTDQKGAGSRVWGLISMSADGTVAATSESDEVSGGYHPRIFILSNTGKILAETNEGPADYKAIELNTDGNRLFVINNGNSIWEAIAESW